MAGSPLVVSPRGRTVLEARPLLAAAGAVLVGFALFGGLPGAAVGVATAAALAVGGPLLAYLTGTIVLLGVGDAVGLTAVPGHLLLATFLVGAVTVDRGRRLGLLMLLGVSTYLGLYVGVGAIVDGLAATTGILALLISCLSYVIHRYELLTLGLIDE